MVTLTVSAVAAAEPQNDSHVQASIHSESQSITPGRPFWVAVRLAMQDGWHVYWKNQGDSGLPTKIEWRLPEGFTADPLLWPAPRKFGDSNVTNYGYDSEAIFLCKISPPALLKDGETASIKASVQWMECADVCVPGKADLSLMLPVTNAPSGKDPQQAETFARANLRMPRSSAGWFLRARHYRNKITLVMVAPPGINVSEAYFFSEAPGQLDSGAPQTLKVNPKSRSLELWCGIGYKQNQRRLKGVLTYKDPSGNQGAVNVSIPISRR